MNDGTYLIWLIKYLAKLSIVLTSIFPVTAVAAPSVLSDLIAADQVSIRPIVSLDVTVQTIKATNINSSASFPVGIVNFRSGDQNGYLHTSTPVNVPDGARLDLSVETDRGRRTVNLPEEMNARILNYLRLGHPCLPFDCSSFVHYMNGVDFHFGEFDDRRWVVETLTDEGLLKEGDTILLGHNRKTFTHGAIYLGDGLYLSKFGPDGPLIITDVPAMKIGFGGNEVFRSYPIAQP